MARSPDDPILVQGRLRGLDGAAIARTATSGAERREVDLGSAGEYAGSYDVVHDDAAGAACDGQGVAGQRASVPPLEARHFGGNATDCSVPYRRSESGSNAGLESALEVVVAIDNPEAYGPKRASLPPLGSELGHESGIRPGDRAVGGFQPAGAHPGRSGATLGDPSDGHDLPVAGGIEDVLTNAVTG